MNDGNPPSTASAGGASNPGRSGRAGFITDLRFSYKIFSLPLLAAVSFILVLLAVLVSGWRNEALMADIETGHVPALLLCRDLEENLANLQRTLQDAAASLDEGLLKETDGMRAGIMERIRSARKNRTLDETELQTLEKDFGGYYELATGTTRQIIRGATGEELTGAVGKMTASYSGIRDLLAKSTLRQKAVMEQAFKAARSNQARSLRISVGIIVLCLALLVTLFLVMVRTLTRALNMAVGVTSRVAAGDLTVSLEQGRGFARDEVGTMLTSLGAMTQNLRGMLYQVKASSGEVFCATEEMATAYAQIKSGADAQVSLSLESTAVIEEMAASIGEISRVSQVQHASAKEAEEGMMRIAEAIRLVAEGLTEADRIAGESRSLSRDGAEAARQAGDSMQKMSETVRKNTESIREVSRHSSEIESILTIIEESASLTHVAGEALARLLQGTERTAEIVGRINESSREQGRISTRTLETVKNLGAISTQVSRAAEELQITGGQIRKSAERMSGINRHVVAATGEQATQSRSVVEDVREMSELTRRVSTATEEQSRGSTVMTAAISRIAEVANQNLVAAKRLTATTEKLATQAEALRKTGELFRT